MPAGKSETHAAGRRKSEALEAALQLKLVVFEYGQQLDGIDA
jgi:hypothetical protein